MIDWISTLKSICHLIVGGILDAKGEMMLKGSGDETRQLLFE